MKIKKILIVDDSESMRTAVVFALQGEGYEMVEAVDGRDALAKLKNAEVDMVITDLNMPVMDGIELIRAIRSDSALKFMPILMITSENALEKRIEGKHAGATGWIVKPFRIEQFTALIRRFID